MAKREQSYGTCKLCGYRATKASMTKHLAQCIPQHQGTGKARRVLHLRVEDAHKSSPFWLEVAVDAEKPLRTLDGFLRAIWLECCGHLSCFEIDRVRYQVNPEGMDGRSMDTKMAEVLHPGLSFSHEYDFGSTTELKLKVQGEYQIAPPENVWLLVRNQAPQWKCNVCDQAATQLDTECGWEMENPFFCDQHAEEHVEAEHDGDNYMMMPVVNSPRMGVCGYAGPGKGSPYFEALA